VTNLLIEEETVGKVTAVPDFSTAAGARSRIQSRQPVTACSPGQDEDFEEDLKSPTKIRKVVRNSKGKGTALNKAIKTKSRITLHRSSKSATVDEEVEDEDGGKFDDLMEHEEEEEEEDREGLIELDGEEEAAFANLGMHDASSSLSQ